MLFIPHAIIRLQTNKICINKTHSNAMYHKVKITPYQNKINFHLLLDGKSLNKLLTVEFHTPFLLIFVS